MDYRMKTNTDIHQIYIRVTITNSCLDKETFHPMPPEGPIYKTRLFTERENGGNVCAFKKKRTSGLTQTKCDQHT